MKLATIAVVVVYLLSSLGCSGQTRSSPLIRDDFTVQYAGSNVFLTQSYYTLVSKRSGGVGAPEQVERLAIPGRGSLFVSDELVYSGMSVSFSFQHVEKITVFGRQAKTARGLTVGMPEKEVIAKYGHDMTKDKRQGSAREMTYRMKVESDLVDAFEVTFEMADREVQRIVFRILYHESKLLTIEDFAVVSKANKGVYHVLQDIDDVENGPAGSPESVSKTENNTYEYRYPGISFFCMALHQETYLVLVSGDILTTPRGVAVGDSRQKVIETYGIYDELTEIRRGNDDILNYRFTDFGLEEVFGRVFNPYYQALVLTFRMERDRVKQIELSYLSMGD